MQDRSECKSMQQGTLKFEYQNWPDQELNHTI